MSFDTRSDISAPNLTSVCIDSHTEVGSCGRLYNCYSGEQIFTDEFQLLKNMDRMMDKINYPQASMNSREYEQTSAEEKMSEREKFPSEILEKEIVKNERGELATFLIHVMYRQHATWQGIVMWKEKKMSWYFKSVLELLKIMNNVMEIPA